MAIFYLFLLTCRVLALGSSGLDVIQRRQLTSEATKDWVRGDEAHVHSPVLVHIALTQRNIASGVEALLDISDPGSSKYGQHWTPHEVASHFSPAPEAIWSVTDWLNSSGISSSRLSRSDSRGYLEFRSTVGEASNLLQTKFHHFVRRSNGDARIVSDEYHIPSSLSSSVDYISATGLDGLPLPSHQSAQRSKLLDIHRRELQHRQDDEGARVNCKVYTAPSCLREIYDVPRNTPTHPNNSIGMYQIAWATWIPQDLDLFFNTFQPSLTSRRPIVERVNGGYMQTEIQISPFNLEPNLNFQYAISLTNPQEVTNVQVGDQYGGNINNMLAAFDRYYCHQVDPAIDPMYPNPLPGGWNKTADCGTLVPPKTLSITYGDSEANFPPEYIERQCLEFLKLGLMGTTVIASSGDYGPMSGYSPGTCINPDSGTSNATTGRFSPTFPASCPWLTSVGGTQMISQSIFNTTLASESASTPDAASKRTEESAAQSNETAWDQHIGQTRLGSGGGFSNVFSAPNYQLKAVKSYEDKEKAHLKTVKGLYNRGGRGFPDVSALASSYLMAMHGKIVSASGTSASAPVIASIITIINNERMNAGKSTVGFINPVLYENPDVLSDVTTGQISGCGADPAFRASEGWDAVTGLGSPNYNRLLELFLSLP